MRKPLILLVALLALGGLAYWDEVKTRQEEEAKKNEKKLFAFNDAELETLVFERHDDEENVTINFEKKDGKWLITSPVEAAAEQDEVINLIKNIKEYQYEKVADENKDKWSAFGLDKPRIKVTLTGKGDPVVFLMGAKAPVGYSVYVAKGDSDKVYLGGQYIDLAISKKLHDFRDKSFANIKLDELISLRFDRPGEKSVVLKKESDAWTMKEPMAAQADVEEITGLVSAINDENVTSFIDESSPDLLKALREQKRSTKTIAKLGWETKDQETMTLTFLENNDELYATYDVKKQAFRLSKSLRNKLAKSPMDFRYRRIFTFDPLQARAVTLDGIAFEKKDGNWVKAEKGEAASHIGLLLSDLSYAKTDTFEDLGGKVAKSLSAPKHTIAVDFDNEETPKVEMTVWVDPKDKEKFFLKSSVGKHLFRVDSKVLNNVSPATAAAASPASGLEGLDDHGHDDGHDHG